MSVYLHPACITPHVLILFTTMAVFACLALQVSECTSCKWLMCVSECFNLKKCCTHRNIPYVPVLYLNGTTNESALVRALKNVKPFLVKSTEVLRHDSCVGLQYYVQVVFTPCSIY